MPNPSIRISAEIDLQTTRLRQQTATAVRQGMDEGTKGARVYSASMQRLTGDLQKFDNQLDRANKRVLAFGASATIIYGTVRAFKELVVATVQVEKSLASINSIFQLSRREIDAFGKNLFDVARQTAQSFRDTAKAAEEFSRQGLSATETAKRTRDAMILVRLTGLEAAKSVDLLTAAMNTFGKTGADTTKILNTIVAVDQKFAVSARDIANAIARTGSVIDDANVSLEEFAGLVTAARQITSRDGTVIGNSLKSIFTRLERSSTLDALEALGIAVRDAGGEARNALDIFNEVAKSYKNLTREQQQQVAELGAGVFQINQFKALINDLGKANGIAAQATKIATSATNEALIRNAALNDTLATSLQNLKTTATQASAIAGQLTLKPALDTALGAANSVLNPGGILSRMRGTGDTKAAEDFGAYLGESMLKGLGNVLGGPGLLVLAKALTGTFVRVMRDAGADFREALGFKVFGMGGARKAEEASLTTVNNLLAQGTKAELLRFKAAQSVAEQEAAVLAILEAQIAAQNALIGGGGGRGLRGGAPWVGKAPRAAEGYVPIAEEAAAIAQGVGGAPTSARPVYLPSFNRGGGQRGIVANTSEWMVPMGASGFGIWNREMIQKMGLPPGSKPVAAKGFIPNAAGNWYSVPPSYRTPAPGQVLPYFINPPVPMAPAVSSATASATGQGFGQFLVKQQEAVLKQQAANAAYEARVIAQRAATAQGEAQEWAREMARQRAISGSPMFGGQATAPINAMFANDRYGRVPAAAQQSYVGANQAAWSIMGWAERKRVEDAAYQQDLRKDREMFQREQVRRELERRAAAEARSQRLHGISNRVMMGTVGASFASSFLPEGTSGQASGMGFGALSGGLQGASIGSFAGSLAGPLGTIYGAIIGGLGGAIMGFNTRARKSFEELAKEIEDSNSRSRQLLEGASQFLGLQTSIKEAIDKGQSGTVINALFQQQRTAAAGLPSGVVRQLLGAGFDAEKQAEALASLNAVEGDRISRNQLLGGFASLGGKTPLNSEQIASLAANVRSSISGEITPLRGLTGLKGRAIGSVTADPGTFAYNNQLNKYGDEALQMIGAVMAKTSLDPAQQQEVLKSLGGANGSQLFAFLDALKKTNETGPLLDVSRQTAGRLGSLRNPLRNLIRTNAEQLELGGLRGGFRNRIMSMREQATLGLGDLSEGGAMMAGAGFNLAQAQREAALGRGLGLAGARNRMLDITREISTPEQVRSILGAAEVADFEKIAQAFKGQEMQEQLSQVVTELKRTVEQNNQLVSLAEEQNRIEQIAMQAAQQQRLLAGGTFSGDTRATSRSLFSRLGRSSGAASGANAIALSDYLSRVGLPQTDESLGMERDIRGVSVRDNIASILSGRLRRPVGSSVGDIEAALGQLGGSEGDAMLSSRVRAGLGALQFDPAAARAELLGGGASQQTIAQLSATGQIGAGTLVLKGPLDNISVSSKETVDVLERIQGIIEARANISAIGALQGESVLLQQRMNDPTLIPRQQADMANKVGDLNRQIKDLEAKLVSNKAAGSPAVSTSVLPAPTEGGMMAPFKVSARGGRGPAGPTESFFGTFASGFGGSLESSVKGPFATIEEAMMSLEDVGARVGASLESNLSTAFGDFVTGAEKGKDAFRQFAASITADAARAFASKGVQQLLGFLFTALGNWMGASMATGSAAGAAAAGFGGAAASGGPIGFAVGGRVPAKVMKGEVILGPSVARRLGPATLNAINTGAFQRRAAGGALVTGGSGYGDDVNVGLPPQSYVVRKAMVDKYGVGFFSGLAAGGTASVSMATSLMGGSDPLTPLVRGYSEGGATASLTALPASSTGGGVTAINTTITINDQRSSASSEASTGGNATMADRQFGADLARQMEQVALRAIEKQTRVGGILRPAR